MVVAVGVGCTAAGLYLTIHGRSASTFWPDSAGFQGSGALWSSGTALTGWELLLIWLGLTAGWALTSLWVLRPAAPEL